MTTAVGLISAALIICGFFLILGLSPQVIAEDIASMLEPPSDLRRRALSAQGKHKRRLIRRLMHVKAALDSRGGMGFGIVCMAAILLTAGGAAIAILADNKFLIPVLAAAGAAVPFMFATGAIESYDRRVDSELETALSIITSAYLRTGDIIESVRVNLGDIRPPVRDIFREFVTRATVISSDIPACLEALRDRIDNTVFYEWCETLIACCDDFSNSDTLVPVVGKLTQIRLVNNELETRISACRREYITMALMVIGSIPLLYIINKSWFHTLVTTVAGKLAVAVCFTVILVTAALMLKYTKPLDYSGKKR